MYVNVPMWFKKSPVAYQYPVQQCSGSWISSDPESDEVSAQLSVSEQSVVDTGREKCRVEVSGQCSLTEGQLLHLGGRVLVPFLNDGLHDEAGCLNDGQRGMLEQLEQSASQPRHKFQHHVKLFSISSLTVQRQRFQGIQ